MCIFQVLVIQHLVIGGALVDITGASSYETKEAARAHFNELYERFSAEVEQKGGEILDDVNGLNNYAFQAPGTHCKELFLVKKQGEKTYLI